MSTILSRLQRATRQLVNTTWTADRALDSLPSDANAIILLDDVRELADVQHLSQRHKDLRISVYNLGKTDAALHANNLDLVHVVDMQTLHAHLRRQPSPYLLVDLLHDARQKEAVLRQCFYYLKDNGIFLSAHLDAHSRGIIKTIYTRRNRKNFNEHAEAAIHKVGAKVEKDPTGPIATDRLAAAMKYLRFTHNHALLRKQFTHLIKLRDSELDSNFAATRGIDWMRDHRRHPAGLLLSQATLRLNHERFAHRFPKAFNLPELRIREYDNVTCLRREVVYRSNLFLPDSFRLTGQDYLRNVAIQDVDINFAMPGKQKKAGSLPGAYYHLDTEYPNVYGHLLTDMIGRLWAWRELKAQHPDLKVLISDRADKHDLPGWVRTMLHAYGIQDTDIELLHAPMRVEKLYAPTPQFVNYQNGYVHPNLVKVWADLRDSLASQSTAVDLPTKVFISRVVDQHRLCRNRDDVEQYFTDNGFTVLRPETLPQADQVVLFSNATHIAGYGGSAMLTGIFSNGVPKKRLIINPWTHHPINEYLISSVYGDDITYLYQEPEITKATETKPQQAFHSPYTFDFENGRPLLERFITG